MKTRSMRIPPTDSKQPPAPANEGEQLDQDTLDQIAQMVPAIENPACYRGEKCLDPRAPWQVVFYAHPKAAPQQVMLIQDPAQLNTMVGILNNALANGFNLGVTGLRLQVQIGLGLIGPITHPAIVEAQELQAAAAPASSLVAGG